MDCNKVHTLMEEKDDKKSTLTAKDNDKQDCSYAAEDRGTGERESKIAKFAEGFCGCGER